MAIKTDTRLCAVTATWEYGVTGYTPEKEETKTVSKTVTIYQTWRYHAMYGEWVTSGSSWENPSGGSNYRGSYPSAPSYSSYDGDTTITSASGTADFTEKVTTGGDPIYGWFRIGTSHSHASSISYDDGTYAGTLLFVSCDVSSVPSPSFNGYNGQQAETTGNGTAHYSGDVPLKGGGRPKDWEWTSLYAIAWTKNSTKVELVTASDWNGFCSVINDFRKFKGLGAYTFTSASIGSPFTNTMYQQAVTAISAMKPVSQPTGLYSKLVALKNALNSVT